MIPFGPKPVPENRWFESKPLWARIVIMIAGVVDERRARGRRRDAARASLRRSRRIRRRSSARSRARRQRRRWRQLQRGDTIVAVNGTACATGTKWTSRCSRAAGSVAARRRSAGDVALPLGDVDDADARSLESLVPFLPPVIDTVFPDDPRDGRRAAAKATR